MAILTETRTWRRKRSGKLRTALDRLDPEQEQNVRAALRFLRVSYGTYPLLAKAIGVHVRVLENTLSPQRRAGAGLAIHLARLAGVSTEDVLTGRYLKAGACPLCGRLEPTP